MGFAFLTLLAAVIGGAVSLTSVLIAQRGAERSRELESRRAAYTRLHAAVRDARDALAACLHDLEDGPPLDENLRDKMEERWLTYVTQQAEAPMVVSDDVLAALSSVNGPLRAVHGLVRRLHTGTPAPGEDLALLSRRMDALWSRLIRLRETMRKDLGVADPPR